MFDDEREIASSYGLQIFFLHLTCTNTTVMWKFGKFQGSFDLLKTFKWDVYAVEPVAPKFNLWSSFPITFDRRDHPTSIRHGGSAALFLDPIIDGFHLTQVRMDGVSSLNLLYQDTVRKKGINPSRIKPTKITFKGVIPGVEARCTGSITLDGGLRFSGQFPKRGVNLRHCPIPQWLRHTARTNSVC